MKRYLLLASAFFTLGLAGFAVASAADPPGGGDPCSHGATGKPCRTDPQPDHGQDCDPHGNSNGNEDHCLTTSPSTSTPTTTKETTTSPTTTTTPDSTSTATTPTSTPSTPTTTSSATTDTAPTTTGPSTSTTPTTPPPSTSTDEIPTTTAPPPPPTTTAPPDAGDETATSVTTPPAPGPQDDGNGPLPSTGLDLFWVITIALVVALAGFLIWLVLLWRRTP